MADVQVVTREAKDTCGCFGPSGAEVVYEARRKREGHIEYGGCADTVGRYSTRAQPGMRGTMSYFYERCGPDRFQDLAQAILLDTYPDLQCFPIGQPDGGRDGLDRPTGTVVQVKFRRSDEPESAEWLIDALAAEVPKVNRLAAEGAANYLVVTNARGTAHLGGGRIDKVQQWLDDNMPIASECLWRADLDRRVEGASSQLLLRYPELLALDSGIDIVLERIVARFGNGSGMALRAYVATEFERDRTLKFKQVDLSNDLLDLFIDVPAGIPESAQRDSIKGKGTFPHEILREGLRLAHGREAKLLGGTGAGAGDLYVKQPGMDPTRISIGAGQLLLNEAFTSTAPLVVVEGAPGQGKSTLGQYICQLHRARYLGRAEEIARFPDGHVASAFRLPIKIDLRDFATFLGGRAPFEQNELVVGPRSIEVFLASLVSYRSGGLAFSSDDWVAILGDVPILLFLDGLDEVADFEQRDLILQALRDGLARWAEFNANVQVVVTSRPSVFGQAPDFEGAGFVRLTLKDMPTDQVTLYARQWAKARALQEDDRREVEQILKEKLTLPHIRDLTKNPMQLTILLSLLHQVGYSLPDQRTELYNRYLDLFLTREAEKSRAVRDHRELLVEFVQFLAWTLQTQAEASSSAGSIARSDLRRLAHDYLRDTGRPIELANELIERGVERIFILVERIEGLFEFEVQPLREYFCAIFLHSTAPVGNRSGVVNFAGRGERFVELAIRPYWLNVCRFYAGACERGEAATLVYGLRELMETGDEVRAAQARRVALALLRDRVFSGANFAQADLVRSVFADARTSVLVLTETRHEMDLRLELDCGRNDLRDILTAQILDGTVQGESWNLCTILRSNGGDEKTAAFAASVREGSGVGATHKFASMCLAGAVSLSPPDEVWELLTHDSPGEEELRARCRFVAFSEPELAMASAEIMEVFQRAVLDADSQSFGSFANPLFVFASVLAEGSGLALSMRASSGVWSRRGIGGSLTEGVQVHGDVGSFLDDLGAFGTVGDRDSLEMFDRSDMWKQVVESARRRFGENWSAYGLAAQVAGVRRADYRPLDAGSLLDTEVPLCDRARYARLWRGNAGWWAAQLADDSDDLDRSFWVAMAVLWSSATNLFQLRDQISETVASLDDARIVALQRTVDRVARRMPPRSDRAALGEVDLRGFSPSAGLLVAHAFPSEKVKFRMGTPQAKSGQMRDHLALRAKALALAEPLKVDDLESRLERLRLCQSSMWEADDLQMPAQFAAHSIKMTRDLSVHILKDPDLYPLTSFLAARSFLERRTKTTPLVMVAERDHWEFIH